MPELKYVKLADENFNKPGRIDLLLSAEFCFELLRPGQICPVNSNLIFKNAVFGYVASGRVPVPSHGKAHCGFIQDNTLLNVTMVKFWGIEDVQNEVPENKEAITSEEHFEKNVKRCQDKRDSTGRYIVKMPLIEDPMYLGNPEIMPIKN